MAEGFSNTLMGFGRSVCGGGFEIDADFVTGPLEDRGVRLSTLPTPRLAVRNFCDFSYLFIHYDLLLQMVY